MALQPTLCLTDWHEGSQCADRWSLQQVHVLVCVHTIMYEVIRSSTACWPKGLNTNASGWIPAVQTWCHMPPRCCSLSSISSLTLTYKLSPLQVTEWLPESGCEHPCALTPGKLSDRTETVTMETVRPACLGSSCLLLHRYSTLSFSSDNQRLYANWFSDHNLFSELNGNWSNTSMRRADKGPLKFEPE